MKIFEALREEICLEENGILSPDYYTYLGYRRDFTAPPSQFRANGLYALLAETKPRVLKNEWITGNKKSLYTEEQQEIVKYAEEQVEAFGKRWFRTNFDHYAVDYAHVLKGGIVGLINEIDASLKRYENDPKKQETLGAMRHTLCGLQQMIRHYGEEAENCKGKDGYDDERLTFIIDNCRVIENDKPRTFAQALQLVWFCHTAFVMEGRYAMALGRIDQYLYPFYKTDTTSGALTNERAIELLENVFVRLHGDTVNICIGGQNPQGECEVNELSLCVLHAVNNCHIPGPNLSLRLTENTPDAFFDECLKVIGTGLGYPAIMNDDVNIEALRRYGYDEEDLYNYCMVGCIENFLPGKQPPWSDSGINGPLHFDYIFNHGFSAYNKSWGIDTGDIEDIHTMQEFIDAFEKQLAHSAEKHIATIRGFNDSINQDYFADPFLSALCDDCVDRGLDIHQGGCKYPSAHGVGITGIATVCDSLAAIEKVVFDNKEATLADIKDALEHDFEGYEELQKKLIAAPKYGNNDDYADKYAVWLIDLFHSLLTGYKTRDGGNIYIAIASNIWNVIRGHQTNATPNGRKKGTPLSDAASPSYGCDVRGTTASVLSLSKPDYTKAATGTVVNHKFSPSMFDDQKRPKLAAMIRTYFKRGGQELQINSTSRAVLEDAMQHPENYRSLVVRVSGFSAFYTTLDHDIQLDILNRTQKDF